MKVFSARTRIREAIIMLNLEHVKLTRRDQQVLKLLQQQRDRRELQARHPRHRPIWKEANELCPRANSWATRKIRIAKMVWQGQTNPEIARAVGTIEQVIKNHLRNVFDQLGVWSRLELAL
jgi:DNA-binding NarL/FixJ family response regulator